MMMKNKKYGFLLVLSLLLAVLLVGGCSTNTQNVAQPTQELKVLRVGAIPSEDSEKVREAYKPLVSYLEKKLGLKVELFVATDYAGVVEAMRSGKLDIAYFGPFSYVLAADKANAEAFAVENKKGSGTSYRSIIVADPKTGINSIEDLKGHTFAFVDPASTSGNLIPRSFLKSKGINPEQDFKSVIYAGGHDADELAVKNHKVDAAADADVNYSKMKGAGIISDTDVKVIFTSDPIPNSPWAWRKDLPDDLKEKIKAAFLNMAQDDPTDFAAQGKGLESYVEAKDATYNVIRDTAKILNLDLAKQ
ncbi:phosphonate transport system substrate-binding protein [Sporomusaceae bacterium BoRhaA]|uniref:phosphonate ABC transporter substrate-binding protein n=1 Tax=Pelorhabdus rhamnosifermentans TaxID=2772457 RepID=UPI001C05F079|nr:phosphonate ABC transporter substrate-binding protein [Pelorhabdus rhamnosifermentans]MBU2699504.1 phosphonate transport system substrate-binding protein [Pelorhabdus rhamnosifermentans]